MSIRRRLATCVVFAMLIVCLTFASSAHEAPRAAGNVAYVLSVYQTSNCSNVSLNLYIRSELSSYVHSKIKYDGHIVADAVVNASYPGGQSVFISSGYSNDTGLAPIDFWPLEPGKKVAWTITIFTSEWQPVYEARAVLKSCDSMVLKSVSQGPAYQLLENHGFEQAEFGTGGAGESGANFWTRTNAANDIRDCSGASEYIGSCGFRFIADAGTTTKVKQKYKGTIGQAGDIATVATFFGSSPPYSGGGKIKALLTFANGATHTLTIAFPSGQHLFPTFPDALLYSASYPMPASLISATVTIQQKNGTGQAAVDGVTLTVFTATGAAPRAFPPPVAP